MRTWSKLLAFTIGFGVLCAAQGVTKETPITVTLQQQAPLSEAQCPQTMNFTATVHAAAGAKITYRFERSTGNEPNDEATLATGSMQFADSWTRGRSGTIYVRFHVLTPQDVVSNKVTFTVHCPGGTG